MYYYYNEVDFWIAVKGSLIFFSFLFQMAKGLLIGKYLYNVETGEKVDSFHLLEDPDDAVYSMDGTQIVISQTWDRFIWWFGNHYGMCVARLFDAENGKEIKSFSLSCTNNFNINYSPDGNSILIVYENGEISIWDANGIQEKKTFRNQCMTDLIDTRFSPNGDYFLSCFRSENSTNIQIWQSDNLLQTNSNIHHWRMN